MDQNGVWFMPIKASNGDSLIDCLRKAKTLLDEHKVPSKGRVLERIEYDRKRSVKGVKRRHQ